MNSPANVLADYSGEIPEKDATSVFLYGVKFTSPQDFHSLAQYTKMQQLNLAWSDVNDACLDVITSVSTVQGLESLDLDATPVTDEGLKKLARIKNLKYLRLKEMDRITDEGIKYLQLLRNLQSLHLGETPVTIEGVKHLVTLPLLTDLLLDADLIEKSPNQDEARKQFADLSRQMPQCEILFKGYGLLQNSQWE